jgi:glycine cleavage system transcriptional repressor
MMKAVISGIGPDRPGIVAAISEILFRYNCNIEDSTMTRLAREFAVILLVSAPEALPLEALRADFAALEASHDMLILIKPAPELAQSDASRSGNPYMVSVAGQDRTGITLRVSRALADLDVNITDLNAQIIAGEDGPVYIMMVEVELPEKPGLEETVRAALRELAGELGVDIRLRPLETVAL